MTTLDQGRTLAQTVSAYQCALLKSFTNIIYIKYVQKL
jgi:hypothetical protein